MLNRKLIALGIAGALMLGGGCSKSEEDDDETSTGTTASANDAGRVIQDIDAALGSTALPTGGLLGGAMN